MGTIVLVTGGARSGKSRFAEQIAGKLGALCRLRGDGSDWRRGNDGAGCPAPRPATWRPGRPLRPHTICCMALQPLTRAVEVVLIDCLTIWSANRLLRLEDTEMPAGGTVSMP